MLAAARRNLLVYGVVVAWHPALAGAWVSQLAQGLPRMTLQSHGRRRHFFVVCFVSPGFVLEEEAQEVTHDQEKPAKSYPGNLVQESTKGLFGTQKGCKAGPPMCSKTGYKRPFELREG